MLSVPPAARDGRPKDHGAYVVVGRCSRPLPRVNYCRPARRVRERAIEYNLSIYLYLYYYELLRYGSATVVVASPVADATAERSECPLIYLR
uniref:Uncharacterized protein n=1 Tax=Pararge aegeria TaxID=116150 RepID=S4PHT3_9NEOP